MKALLSLFAAFFALIAWPQTAAERNAAARAELVDGVSVVDCKSGLPGPFICLHDDAFGVIAARNYDRTIHPLIAAAFYGKGRVIAYGHPGFICTDELVYDTKRFNANAIKWLANGKPVTVGVLNDADVERMLKSLGVSCELVKDLDAAMCHPIVACYSDRIRADEMPKLAAYVREGGGFMTAALAWGWKSCQKKSGQVSLARYYEPERLLSPFGIVAGDLGTNRTAPDGKGYDVKTAFPLGSTVPEALAILKEDPLLEKSPAAKQVAKTFVQTAAAYPADESELYRQLKAGAASAGAKTIPSPKTPFRDSDALLARVALILRQNDWQADPLALRPADPAAASYPGLVASNAVRLADVEVPVDLTVPRWQSTGLFAPAGEQITIRLPEGAEKLGLKLRIGTTADDVTANNEWKRAPLVTMQVPLDRRERVVSSPFGGLVYVECTSPSSRSTSSLSLSLSGAVRAPWFKLGRDSNADWAEMLAESGAPQAELQGKHLILTVDRRNAGEVKDPVALMTFWDRILAADAKLTGYDAPQASPERICSDVQLTGGLLHDGYPVMYYLSETGVDEVLDLRKLTTKGAWGVFHELGHNHQNRAWTFGGMGEVTVNLFTLYNFEQVVGLDARAANPGMTDLESAVTRVTNFRDTKYTFDGFKSDPFLALECLIRLKEVYGWELFEKMFREYRHPVVGKLPGTEEERIDQYAERMSRLTKQNLAAYFVKWQWPISARVRLACAKYPVPEDPRLWAYLDGVPEDAVVKLHLTPEKVAISNNGNWPIFNVKVAAEARQRKLIVGLRTGAGWQLKVRITDETTGKDYAWDHVVGDMSKDLYDDHFYLATTRYGLVPEPGHAYTVALAVYEQDRLRYEGTSAKGAFTTCSEDYLVYGPQTHEPKVARRPQNPLTGLRTLFIGDSITEAICEVHVPALWYTAGWPGRIGWANGMRWMNRGRSGATLSNVWGGGNSVRKQLDWLDDYEFDFILAHGGINDGMGKATCGDVTPGRPEDYDGEGETFKTVAGSLEHLFWKIRRLHPEAKVGYVINYRVAPEIWSNCGPQFAEFIPTIRKVCAKWGVPYVDLWNNESIAAQTRPGSQTSFGDSLHANDRGYDIVTPYIQEFMEAVVTGKAKPGEEYHPADHVFDDPVPDVVTPEDVNVALGKPVYAPKPGWNMTCTDGVRSGRSRMGGTTNFAHSDWNPCSATVDLGGLHTIDKVRAFTGFGNGVANWAAWGTAGELTDPLETWTLLYKKENTRMSTALGTSGAFKPIDVRYVRFVCFTEYRGAYTGFTEIEVYGKPCDKKPSVLHTLEPGDEDISIGRVASLPNSRWTAEIDTPSPVPLAEAGQCYAVVPLKGLCEIEKLAMNAPQLMWRAYATEDPAKPISEWTLLGEKNAIVPFKRGENVTNDYVIVFPKMKARLVRIYGLYSPNREGWWPGPVKVIGRVLEPSDPKAIAQLTRPEPHGDRHTWSRWTASAPCVGDKPGELRRKCTICEAFETKPAVDPVYGANLAIACKTVSYQGKDYPCATDGDRHYGLRWRGILGGFESEVSETSGCWAQIDLGERRAFSHIRICDEQENNPNFFSVYVSDDPGAPISDWRLIAEKRDGRFEHEEGHVLKTAEGTSGRYVRIYATRHNGAFGEIEIYR